jgi:hypothetical protein
MKQQKTLLAITLLASASITGIAHASLIDRGNGLLYDDVLNVTWLQDANYAHTSGYAGTGITGAMDWATAMTWAADLVYGGYSDWRLPTNTPVNGSSFNYTYSLDGSTDMGSNVTSPHSELAYMYHVNLGLKGVSDTAGNDQSDFGIFGNGTYNGVDRNSHGQNNVGLVSDLQNWAYWSDIDFSPSPIDAWAFATYLGIQVNQNKIINQYYAWAVRPGDVTVSSVPVPAAFWLFGSGLIALASFTRRKNKSANLIAA